MAPRKRLDLELIRRSLAATPEVAAELILGSHVLVGGSIANNPARMVDPSEAVQLRAPKPEFVSRAGGKLSSALDLFSMSVTGLNCLDVGSSTGGFTDCLLQRGARTVTSIDVGTNQLHETIRTDARVVVMEQTDIRSVESSSLDAPFDLLVGDLSFVSLTTVLPAIVRLSAIGSDLIMLIKPQFEASHEEVSKGSGIIRSPIVWSRVIAEVSQSAGSLGAPMIDIAPSPIRGSAGNVEFTGRFSPGSTPLDLAEQIEAMLDGITP